MQISHTSDSKARVVGINAIEAIRGECPAQLQPASSLPEVSAPVGRVSVSAGGSEEPHKPCSVPSEGTGESIQPSAPPDPSPEAAMSMAVQLLGPAPPSFGPAWPACPRPPPHCRQPLFRTSG